MNKNFLIKATYKFPNGCKIEPAESAEVSLDDSVCKKRYRTIVITKDKNKSYCPQGKHQFNAVITKIDVKKNKYGKFLFKKELTEIIYYIEYDYIEFFDERNNYAKNNSEPLPSWARIYFNITCPKCNHTQSKSTQNNLVRPYKTLCEKCSTLLYEEKTELPTFEMKI